MRDVLAMQSDIKVKTQLLNYSRRISEIYQDRSVLS